MSIDTTIKTAETKMQAAITAVEHHFNTLRTGRASTALLDDIRVEVYGQEMPIAQIANISTPDARSITIQPWDASTLGKIEKAIQTSDLGINPQNDGKIVRLVLPPLTEERRKELVKKAHHMAEEGRIAIRNVRRHAKEELDKMKKNKEISEDQAHDATDRLQKVTDKWIKKVDEVLAKKEKEIMEV
jgi:ribosome recycling factor